MGFTIERFYGSTDQRRLVSRSVSSGHRYLQLWCGGSYLHGESNRHRNHWFGDPESRLRRTGAAGVHPTAITDGNAAEFVQTQTNILGASHPSGSVLIGSFTINAVAPGPGQLAVDLLNIGTDISVYVDNMFAVLPLDSLNLTAPTFNYNFTAVPEPSSIGGISAIICLRYWRRRKRLVGESEASRWQKWRLSQRRRKKATTPQYCRETGVWS